MGDLMPKSIELRLQELYEKRASLEAQIKQIEAEKATTLRKRQEKRERLVGKAIYALVTEGAWSEQDVLMLVDPYLKRAIDRHLFGLPPLVARGQARRTQQTDATTSTLQAEVSLKGSDANQTHNRERRALTVSLNQVELAKEFNL